MTTYSPFDEPIQQVIDGSKINFASEGLDNYERLAAAQRLTIENVYDANGNVIETSSTDTLHGSSYDSEFIAADSSARRRTRFVYDIRNRVVAEAQDWRRDSVLATVTIYDAASNVTATWAGSTNDTFVVVSQTDYDQFGRPWHTTDQNQNTQTFTYDLNGNLIEIIGMFDRPDGWWSVDPDLFITTRSIDGGWIGDRWLDDGRIMARQ